jgi:hypothetical protein
MRLAGSTAKLANTRRLAVRLWVLRLPVDCGRADANTLAASQAAQTRAGHPAGAVSSEALLTLPRDSELARWSCGGMPDGVGSRHRQDQNEVLISSVHSDPSPRRR